MVRDSEVHPYMVLRGHFKLGLVSLTKLLPPWPNATQCQKKVILYKVVHWSSVYSVRKLLAMPGLAGEYLGSDPKEEESEPVASEGSLSESSGRSGTTWSGEAGGAAAGAVGVVGGGGSAGCAICKGMAQYGMKGSKAR